MPSTRFASGRSLADKTAFLFDLDGTLVDSSPLHQRAFREVLDRRVPELSATFDYETIKGRATVEAFRALGIEDERRVLALTEEKQAAYRASVARGELAPFPMAREVLLLLRARGAKVSLVTSGSRISSTAALLATGLADFFDDGAITNGEGMARAKPHPEIYQRALSRLSLPLASAVAIEDAPSGAASARAAGIDVALVHGASFPWAPQFPDLGALLDALRGEGDRR